ncbi:general amino acid permease 1 [Irpex rosettiformis]|uniref:General amino acid permease 1 n=1 Tax=Irpex rosettiformis TaxID=378272 RepID=A0ACB8UBH2_9APHY|nr:general amino acid permease 1 [Irpex rosettiformis]
MASSLPPIYDTEKDSSSVEKGHSPNDHEYVVQTEDRFHLDAQDLDHVQRKLKQRHVQMIAVAGTIGTGLFLGSGSALAGSGPAGALIAYIVVGSVAYSALCCIGEMTSHAPISGTFPHFAARWVDPALGFALGWNYWYSNAVSIPVEITAATILLTFWDSNLSHQAGYTAVVCVLVCAINIFGVRWFGESEFIFSIIKLLLITGLILVGLIIDLGGGPDHQRRGFQYWRNPGAFAGAGLEPNHIGLDRFLGILNVLVQAGFSFQGLELTAVAASETENPRRNVAKAIRRVFWRILIFYVLGIIITGMLVPFNDPDLLQGSGTAAQSPYVIAMSRAGIKVLPHIVNACIFTSAFSAGNSFLYASSRVLYGLALRGQAPKIFAWCTKGGLPLVAVAATSCFAWLSFMNTSSGAVKVFNWFVNLSTVAGFFSWLGMHVTYLYFYRGMKAQGFDRTKLIYHSKLQPYLSIWGIFWVIIFILVNGISVFWSFNASDFLTSYINIPLFFALYFGWKIIKRTKIWKPMEMDFVTGIPSVEETEHPIEPPKNFGEKVFQLVF